MVIILRHYKILIVLLLVLFSAFIVISCQPVSEESQPETGGSMVSADEPVETVDSGPMITPETESDSESTPVYESTNSENYSLTLTPIDELGITGVAQDVDINEYRLKVSGLVENPLSLTYEDILAYPSVTEIGVINCPGYFLDIAEWTGAPLMMILDEAGLKPEASKLTFVALDGYQQGLTLEHVEKYDVFLAYNVNGEILPPEHGYPLRVVDKGNDGSAWVKWLEEIRIE
jgi:DMSO/TMAO reductase YedYZ molybdopterin-dependent catalytic subunit